MAPLIAHMRRKSDFDVKVCSTGQHREMLDQVLQIFDIKPDRDLDVMRTGQALSALAGRILSGVSDVVDDIRPDLVLVHGDTTTSFAAALASYYHRVPIAHVEAGLRTKNLLSPWPEEGNRQLTGILARYHFCPTEAARDNLIAEGKPAASIFVTGNTVVDALLTAKSRLDDDESLRIALAADFPFLRPGNQLVLITGHRRESFGAGFERICSAIAKAAQRHKEVDFVYPVHLNPKVSEPVNRLLGHLPNVHLTAPQAYLPFVYLMNRSHVILTDSGGIQEEAPSLGKPVLVMRDLTERPEALATGAIKLVGTDDNVILAELGTLLTDHRAYQAMSVAKNPYGDGRASERIASVLSNTI